MGVDGRVFLVPGRPLVLPLGIHQGVGGVRHIAVLLDEGAQVLVDVALFRALGHKALAGAVHHEEGGVGAADAPIVHHHGVGRGLHLTAHPQCHLMTVPIATGHTRAEHYGVGAVVGHHLLIGLIGATGQHHTHRGIVQVVAALGVLSYHAGDTAALILNKLHGGTVVEALGAQGLHGVGQGLYHLVVANAEVGVGMQVHLIAVHGDVALGLGLALVHLNAGRGGLLGEPGDGIVGVIGPGLHELALGAVVAALDEEAHQSGLRRLRHLGGDAGSHVARRLGSRLFLNERHVGPVLGRRHDGRHASHAAAHHDDAVIVGVSELGDGLGSDHEAGRGVPRGTESCTAGSLRPLLLRGASRKPGSGQRTAQQRATLQERSTIHVRSHSPSSLSRFFGECDRDSVVGASPCAPSATLITDGPHFAKGRFGGL